MESLFFPTFFSIFQALLKIFLIAGLAGILTYRKVISEEMIDGMSAMVAKIFLPMLTFATIVRSFDPGKQLYWWTLPLIAVGLIVIGLLFCMVLFSGSVRKKVNLLPLSSMQNAAYLILPIGEFAFKDQFEEFALICFLINLGLNPFMWTVGKLMIVRDTSSRHLLWKILNPPFVANVISMGFVLTGTHRYIPDFVVESSQLLGSATVPVATFILGATLAMSIRSIPSFLDTFRVTFVKFVFIPLVMISMLYLLDWGEKFPLLSQVLVIQSSSAPATAFILMIRTYGGDVKKAGGIIFVSYFICLIAIPFWLTIWNLR